MPESSGTLLNRGGASGREVTIASSGTTSSAFDARSQITFGVFIPSGFEGANISFTVSQSEAGTYVALSDDTGTSVSVPVSDPGAFTLPAALAPWPWFKIVSDATESSARTLRVVSKR